MSPQIDRRDRERIRNASVGNPAEGAPPRRPELYPWQQDLIDKIVDAYESGERVIISMPARRSGMTVVRAEIIRRLHPKAQRDAGRAPICTECIRDWPCPTIRALEEA